MQVTSASLFISIALVVYGISYYYFTTRHTERMNIIQKGLPPDFFKTNNNYLVFILLLGIVSIGISLGIVMGFLLKSLNIDGLNSFILPASIFFFLGISLLVSYAVLKNIHKKG